MNALISIGAGIIGFLVMGIAMNSIVKDPTGTDKDAVITYAVLFGVAVTLICLGL